MAENARHQLLDSLESLLLTGKYSDLVVVCGQDRYAVHKAIVCPRSQFFENAIQFRIGQDAENQPMDLSEDDPATVKLLMQYFYEAEYTPFLPDGKSTMNVDDANSANTNTPGHPHNCPDPSSCSHRIRQKIAHTCHGNYLPCWNYLERRHVCDHHVCGIQCGFDCANFKCEYCCPPLPAINGSSDQLLTHSKMYELADKYQVAGLKDLCIEKFSRACQHFWRDPLFSFVARHVFTTTPDTDKGFRDIICKTISAHMELLKESEIELLLTEFNGLAFGLLREKAEEQGWC